MTIKRLLLGIPIALLLGCGGEDFTSVPLASPETEAGLDTAPDVAPDGLDASADADLDAEPEAGFDAGLDVQPDADQEAGLDAQLDTSPDVAPDTEPDVAPDAEAGSEVEPEAGPDASEDASPDAVTEAGWDATDFDAFADGGQACITGLDQPMCVNASEEPWLVPMVCEDNSWKPVVAEGECNYGCTNGECNCTAPMGRLLVNVVSGPPQQRLIQDTVTGYSWFYESGWTGTAAEAEAFCAAAPGGPYRLPVLEEIKTLMAQRLDQESVYGMTPPDITCKMKNADPVLGEGRSQDCWYKGAGGYGMYGLIGPYWTWIPYQLPAGYVFCIKSP